MKVRNSHNSNSVQVYWCLDEMGTVSKSLWPDGCGRETTGDEDTPPERSCVLLVSRKSLWCRCDSNSKTYFVILSHEEAVSISNHTEEVAGSQGGETLENSKRYLSVLAKCRSDLWIPLPKPHQSKSTALLSVVVLVWFLFLKWFQHVGLWFWNPAILWQKMLVSCVKQLTIQVSIWHKGPCEWLWWSTRGLL